jgi:hypothetical protein
MGEYSGDSSCLTFIQSNKWDSTSDGNGTPREGMTYYNTVSKIIKYYNGTSWVESSENALASDLTMYVDGDSGSDSNDGLAWGSAKKTFTFLRTLPKYISGSSILTINVRGDKIYSSDTIGNLQINNFYGNEIHVIGTPSDISTGITPTGWNNTASSWSYHAYIDVSGATWTTNEHQGRYIQITGSSTYYPILSNTSTRLYSTDLPDLSGANTFKIVEMPKVYPATVSAPGTLVNYSDDFFEVQSSVLIRVRVSNLRFERENTAYPSFWLCDRSYISECYFTNLSFIGGISVVVSQSSKQDGSVAFSGCFFDLRDYGFVSHGYYGSCCMFGNDDSSYESNGTYNASLNKCHVVGAWLGVENYTKDIGVHETLFRNCLYGVLSLNKINVGLSGGTYAARFKDCDTCLALQEGSMQVMNASNNWVVDNCNTQLWLADNNTATFSEIGTRQISNAATGASVVVYDYDVAYEPTSIEEYNNTSSGLVATRYQTAIDELAGIYKNIDIDTGTEAVDSFVDTLGKAVFWDYVVYKSANLRAGRVVACWDAASNAFSYSETSTTDVGSTADLTFSVDIDSNNVRLLAAVASDNWAVKVSRKLL